MCVLTNKIDKLVYIKSDWLDYPTSPSEDSSGFLEVFKLYCLDIYGSEEKVHVHSKYILRYSFLFFATYVKVNEEEAGHFSTPTKHLCCQEQR